jgi:hypothetical protein
MVSAMLLIFFVVSLSWQEAQPEDDGRQEPAAVPVEIPTDAATLIAQIETRYEAFGDIVTELAARKARSRYLRSLLIPIISRADLDAGARNDILSGTADALQAIELDNTAWAVRLLDPAGFDAIYNENSRMALDVLRWAERDDGARDQIITALEPLAMAGTYDPETFAIMVDVHAVSENRPQIYGTQDQCVDGRRELWPLLAPDETANLRAQLGLPVLEEAWAERSTNAESNCSAP